MKQVWVVESGEYEQRSIFLIARSLEAAVTAIKRVYGPPYVVAWDEVRRDGGLWVLAGDFEAVLGSSIQHRAEYDITLWDVEP